MFGLGRLSCVVLYYRRSYITRYVIKILSRIFEQGVVFENFLKPSRDDSGLVHKWDAQCTLSFIDSWYSHLIKVFIDRESLRSSKWTPLWIIGDMTWEIIQELVHGFMFISLITCTTCTCNQRISVNKALADTFPISPFQSSSYRSLVLIYNLIFNSCSDRISTLIYIFYFFQKCTFVL